MQYYDLFALIYEKPTEKQHGKYRLEAVDLLRLQPGQTVLDVPTGTGANLPLLQERIGTSGRIFALDYSPGMLGKARKKVEQNSWQNVELFAADARRLGPDLIGVGQVDAAISMLGMSVMPDWADVFRRMYDLVKPGGRVVVYDLFLEGKRSSTLVNAYYHLIAQADSRRHFWEPLEQVGEDVEIIDHDWPGGIARIVAGTKPAAAIDLRAQDDAAVDLTAPAASTDATSETDQPAP